jgi:hypothetical protein
MPTIKYSYIFDEEIDRVFECFRNAQLNMDVVYNNLITNLKFHKGENFDQENSEFSFFWKKYYYIKMTIENVVNLPHYKTITVKSISIDKICLQITVISRFFRDTVDNKTVFNYEVKFEEEFFADLIKDEIKTEDIDQICLNVEKYLTNIIKGLEINNSIIINHPFELLWNIISSPKKFFNITNKDLAVVMDNEDITMNPISIIYEKSDDNKLNPIIKLRTECIYITKNYGKIILSSTQKFVLPCQKMIFSLRKFDNEKSFFTLNIKVSEPIKHQVFLSLKKLWKKKISIFLNHFEFQKKKIDI